MVNFSRRCATDRVIAFMMMKLTSEATAWAANAIETARG
jgi:hypothetical protein